MEMEIRGFLKWSLQIFRFQENLSGTAFYLDHEQIQMQQYERRKNSYSELNALVVNRLLDHFSSFQFKENMGSIAIGQRLKLSCKFFLSSACAEEISYFGKARNAD